MPTTGNPLLDYLFLQLPVVVFMGVVVWALVKSGDIVPGTVYKKVEDRADKAEARADKAEAENRAVDLLAEQLRRSEARGDEFKNLLSSAVATTQRAASVAETVQRQNSGGG
jgi:hypothetical protein